VQAERHTLNALDRLIGWLNPERGIARLRARAAFAYYEAAKPNTQRKFRQAGASPEQLVQTSAAALRNQMRHLDRNHDITRGALAVLVNNTVGPQGIGVEFQPRRADGSIHTEYAAALAEAYRDWQRCPEVTWRHSWARCQRLAARTWFRDGEVFAQRLSGPVPGLDHGTRVPYSVELIEPDLLPLDFDDESRNIRQSVQRNAWGRATGYWVLKKRPDEVASLRSSADMKLISAGAMLHAAHTDRIGQMRGITPFASVITRIEDIKDYEESERIAAKVAAMLTAYVKRQAPDGGGYEGPAVDANGNPIPRQVSFNPGTIIDTLAVGEEIGLIDSKRPNPNLVTFRNGQLRAFAAGIQASYSSVSRNYDGTYSAQRQEMVEQFVHYACLTDDWVGAWVRPVVEDFIGAAHLSGVVPMPKGVVAHTADDVLYIAPSMPWIDPLKEAMGYLTLCQAGFASEVEVIRRRGGNPDDVLRQIAEYRRKAAEQGVRLATEPPVAGAQQQPASQQGTPDGEDPGVKA
jgi:lambda family phage portal protein